mgnify:FL=1|tara:strand:- start:1484 stop:2692 length:1209 start_codon:yes stop_codon:yes gene_type:complete
MFNKKKIAIIGLGYVGLPLAKSFSKFFQTVGYDIDLNLVNRLNKKSNGDYVFSNDPNVIRDSNIFIITVPTPVNSNNLPDLSFLKSATKTVGKFIKKGDVVIYESTVYPGVTEDICVPILEKFSKLKYNNDFYCGYSPERINPGDKSKSLKNIVKITSGSNEKTANFVDELYNKIIKAGTFKVNSIKIAEASKIVENIQRDVNIALMNEFAMMFDFLNIPTNEVLAAAKTKWNFADYNPGLVGGHCIGIDPYYLIFKAKESGYKAELTQISRKINNSVSEFVVKKVKKEIKSIKNKNNYDILILGYTFKENFNDISNTKVKDIVSGLNQNNCNVDIYDPLVTEDNIITKNPFVGSKKYDIFILAVAHANFFKLTKNDFEKISKRNLVLLDLKNVYSFATWKF